MNRNRVIAVTGKGGTGKTALVALMTKVLTQARGQRVLVIDADSAVSLPLALGIDIPRTVSDIREEIIMDPEVKKMVAQTHISNVIKKIIQPKGNIDMLVMGRPEGAGCFCTVNDLLKYGVQAVSKDYNIILIDCEAGPEQVNRRVIENVDTLIVVADTSLRSLKTANSIYAIAEKGALKGQWEAWLVINKVRSDDGGLPGQPPEAVMTLNKLGWIPYDKNVADYDSAGQSLLDLPEDSPSLKSVRQMLEKLGLQ